MEKQLLSITSMNGDYCQFARYLEITKETSKSIYGEGIYGDTYRLVKQSGEVFVNGEKIADTLRVSGRHVSVDAPFVDGEDNSLLDVLVNSDSPNADRGLVNESLNKEIERALSTLTERERDIVKYFFGIGAQEMTLEEIGEYFGLTRERVRQIKEKAIRRLRHSARSKLLKSYLG